MSSFYFQSVMSHLVIRNLVNRDNLIKYFELYALYGNCSVTKIRKIIAFDFYAQFFYAYKLLYFWIKIWSEYSSFLMLLAFLRMLYKEHAVENI